MNTTVTGRPLPSTSSEGTRPPRVVSIPADLVGAVRERGDELIVRNQPLPLDTLIVHGALQATLLLFLGSAMLGTLIVASLSAFATVIGLTAMFVTLAVMVGLIAAHSGWFAVGVGRAFGPRGTRQLLLGSRYGAVSSVRLVGAVGRELVIRSDRGVLFRTPPTWSGRWTFPHVYWLARAIAARMGVPLHVDADTDAWQRWTRDPFFRARHTFDTRIAASTATYRSWYRIPAEEPRDLRFVEDGQLWHEALLERRGLRTPRFGLAWANILGAQVELYERTWHDGNGSVRQETRARLLLLTHQRVRSTVDLKADAGKVASLLWLRDRVLEHAGAERPDQGSPEDIPRELLAARAL